MGLLGDNGGLDLEDLLGNLLEGVGDLLGDLLGSSNE
jgi:hypothetical protein